MRIGERAVVVGLRTWTKRVSGLRSSLNWSSVCFGTYTFLCVRFVPFGVNYEKLEPPQATHVALETLWRMVRVLSMAGIFGVPARDYSIPM